METRHAKTSVVVSLLALVGLLWLSSLAMAQPVVFNCPNLKAAVEEALHVIDPTPTDMLDLYNLNADYRGITDLTGLEYATNLLNLYLFSNEISDLSPLSGLTNLISLHIMDNQISDLSPLSGLPNLTSLSMNWNQISDLSALSGLTNLAYLHIGENQISDLSPLSGLTNLTYLFLDRNQISDISALSEMTNLKYLWLYGNPLNLEAYCTYLPLIKTNNPGINLSYDPNPYECPPETNCFDDTDNDIDGLTDCADPDCEGETDGACSTGQPGICADGTLTCSSGSELCVQDNQPQQEGPPGDATCSDDLDNDCDGDKDGLDSDCITHTIWASAVTGGSISPSGAVVVNEGADQMFSITADAGYYILVVMVDYAPVGAVTSYTFSNVTADHTIEATFEARTFLISETKPTVTVGATNDFLGKSVSISGDWALVGAPDLDSATGKVYVFKFYEAVEWGEYAILTDTGGVPGDRFGESVAISGNKAVIGAPGDNSDTGSIHLFEFDGTNWNPATAPTLPATIGTGDRYGESVAVITGGMNVLVVGAPMDDSETGSVYVFRYIGSRWEEEKLTRLPSDVATGDRFGEAIAITGDTNDLIVGTPRKDVDNMYGNFIDGGSAYVFRYHVYEENASCIRCHEVQTAQNSHKSGVCMDCHGYEKSRPAHAVRRAKLKATDSGNDDKLGETVAISGDMAVAGAPYDDDAGVNSGSAYVFGYRYDYEDAISEAGTFYDSTNATCTSCHGSAQHSSPCTSCHASSKTFPLPSSPRHIDWNTDYHYLKIDNCLNCHHLHTEEKAKLTASDGAAGDRYGESVAVSGNKAVIGAPYDDGVGTDSGSVYFNKLEAYTPTGTGVVVHPVDSVTGTSPVTVTFTQIDQAGTTNLTTTSCPPPPTGFELGTTAVCFDITTSDTLQYTGLITVCIDYSGMGVSDEGSLQLLHYGNGSPVNVTDAGYPDTVNNIICGTVSFLSVFSVAEYSIIAPPDPVEIDTEITANAPFLGSNAIWDWGDYTTEPASLSGDGEFWTGHHTYSEAGIYTISLTVKDEVGGVVVSPTYKYVVVYDPYGGFVTGGGWINSPEGAYVAVPSLAGKANFGFVSKYKRGAITPTGETEFRFKVADLNFHSDSYDWLVIAGARAKYKGTGTINSEGDYGFMLTAIDGELPGGGGEDKFRIKIWDRDTDMIVYDNQLGDLDDAAPNTLLGGGSIVIHNK